MNAMKKSAVLYHYPCPDGAFAALAAHLYFSAASIPALFFPNPVYNPLRAENLPLEEINDVYLLDFVGPSGFVADISSKVERLIILDHHETALESLSGSLSGSAAIGKNVTSVIDMQRSGATIAFDFFKDKLLGRTCDFQGDPDHTVTGVSAAGHFEKMHHIFKFIEDGDLWRWVLPDSQAFSSGLKDMNIEYDFNLNPDLFDQLLTLDADLIIRHGKETLAHKNKLIMEALERSYQIALGGGRFGHCLAVDAGPIAELRSQLGHQLAEKSRSQNLRGIGAVVYKVPGLKNDSILKISLRSPETEDTTSISLEYGGGGHRSASSFLLSSSVFEQWKFNGNSLSANE